MKKQKYHFGILGGDARLFFTAETLSAHGYTVTSYSVPGIADETHPNTPYAISQSSSRKELIEQSDMLVAPIPFSPFCSVQDCLRDAPADQSLNGKLLFSGPLSGPDASALQKAGIRICNVMEQTEFIRLNAILTAEGVLSHLLTLSQDCIHQSSVLLTGYGHCGREIAGRLKALSALVTVCDTDPAAVKAARSDSFTVLFPKELSSRLRTFDFCINTAPAVIFDQTLLQDAKPEKTLFLDIASAPGGIDWKAAASLGIQAVHLPGLPGKTAPKAAGRFYAETILHFLSSNP
ncbi:MAG: hypothetical protein J6B10_02745 [Lachnospiraceae bacterium]|nr:hypothetical protein [Lachnospiraceae bacterium]